jgi:hypothetical protein
VQENFEEKLNPYVNCGLVLRIKTQDVGRLEEFINNLFGAKIVYLEKAPKWVKLLIKKEAAGEFGNGTTGCNC